MGILVEKLNQAKRATGSYVHDRAEQTERVAVSYAIALVMYAAAGVFLLAAILVGATATFRWLELRYGIFVAFGAMGGLLVVTTVTCSVLAAFRMKRPAKRVTPLASRLRIAIAGVPTGQERLHPRKSVAASRADAISAVTPLVLAALVLAGQALAQRRKSDRWAE